MVNPDVSSPYLKKNLCKDVSRLIDTIRHIIIVNNLSQSKFKNEKARMGAGFFVGRQTDSGALKPKLSPAWDQGAGGGKDVKQTSEEQGW